MAVVLLLTGMLIGVMAIDETQTIMADITSVDASFAVGYAATY